MTRTTSIPQGDTRDRTLVSLSPREDEVSRLVALNRNNGQIAAELGVTEKTAEGYVHRLLQGLGLRSRAELMLWRLQNSRALAEGRSAPAGLHPSKCACGSPTCDEMQRLQRLAA